MFYADIDTTSVLCVIRRFMSSHNSRCIIIFFTYWNPIFSSKPLIHLYLALLELFLLLSDIIVF